MKHIFRIEEPQGEVRDLVTEMVGRYEGRASNFDYMERFCRRPEGALLATRIAAASHLVVVNRNALGGHLRSMLDYAVEQFPVLRDLSQTAIDGFQASVQQGISALSDDAPQYWLPDFSDAIILPPVVERQTETA